MKNNIQKDKAEKEELQRRKEEAEKNKTQALANKTKSSLDKEPAASVLKSSNVT